MKRATQWSPYGDKKNLRFRKTGGCYPPLQRFRNSSFPSTFRLFLSLERTRGFILSQSSALASLYKTARRRSLMPSGEEFPLPIPPRRIQASGTKGDFQGGFPLKTFSSPFFVVSQRMAPTFLLKKKSRQKKTKNGRNKGVQT